MHHLTLLCANCLLFELNGLTDCELVSLVFLCVWFSNRLYYCRTIAADDWCSFQHERLLTQGIRKTSIPENVFQRKRVSMNTLPTSQQWCGNKNYLLFLQACNQNLTDLFYFVFFVKCHVCLQYENCYRSLVTCRFERFFTDYIYSVPTLTMLSVAPAKKPYFERLCFQRHERNLKSYYY